MRLLSLASLLVLSLALSGCEMLGIELPALDSSAAREAESRAIGGACRHAGRAIEDCYTLNAQADKAAIFAGWREMNDYMRENDIREVAPQLPSLGLKRPEEKAVDPEEDAEETEEEILPSPRRR